MVDLRAPSSLQIATLLGLLPLAIAFPHGDELSVAAVAQGGMESMNMNSTTPIAYSESFSQPSYFRFSGYGWWMYGHIITMTLSWVVFLPLSVMFSVARSRYTALLQFFFFASNALGVFLGTVYNAKTPDLYENNAHHKMGWIFTWLALTWMVLGIVNTYSTRSKSSRQAISAANLTKYEQIQLSEQDPNLPRWSGDSGQGTERNSTSLFGSGSPGTESDPHHFDEEVPPYQSLDIDGEAAEADEAENRGFLHNTKVNYFLSRNIGKLATGKTAVVMRAIHAIIERTVIILAFVAFISGIATYGGIFRGTQIFNGVAHFIKGGIFFWYGVLTIARWAGSFADIGWAWNIKPPAKIIGRWKSAAPSTELVESALICFYGISNVWLEHLAAWGEAWTAMDFEHVAITILFFGGGLLGLLIESKRIRRLLNTTLQLAHPPEYAIQSDDTRSATPTNPTWDLPLTSSVSLNPMPALTIMLLGIIMSAHSQHSVLSSALHSYWGSLFVFAAAARLTTYVLNYLRPPVSYYPSRPPSEVLTGFCLVAGGLLFMLSARDIVDAFEGNGWHGMVAFTVGMGVTAVVCAGVVGCIAAKGWALAMENRERLSVLSSLGNGAARV